MDGHLCKAAASSIAIRPFRSQSATNDRTTALVAERQWGNKQFAEDPSPGDAWSGVLFGDLSESRGRFGVTADKIIREVQNGMDVIYRR